jgi:hypothetical protein
MKPTMTQPIFRLVPHGPMNGSRIGEGVPGMNSWFGHEKRRGLVTSPVMLTTVMFVGLALAIVSQNGLDWRSPPGDQRQC